MYLQKTSTQNTINHCPKPTIAAPHGQCCNSYNKYSRKLAQSCIRQQAAFQSDLAVLPAYFLLHYETAQ